MTRTAMRFVIYAIVGLAAFLLLWTGTAYLVLRGDTTLWVAAVGVLNTGIVLYWWKTR